MFKGLNFNEIKKQKHILEEYEGLLPIHFCYCYNHKTHQDFLKNKNLLKEVQKKAEKRRIKFKKSKNKRKFMDEELLKFIKNNNTFEIFLL